MASCTEEKKTATDQVTNAQVAEDTIGNEHCHDDYIHNPEEFIDIHASDRHQKPHSTSIERESLQSTLPNNGDDTRTELPSSPRSDNKDFFHSPSRADEIQNLKVPVQVSEESDTKNSCEMNRSCENSDDEYESADEGEKNDDTVDNGDGVNHSSTANEDEEETSDDDYIAVGDEAEGACCDHGDAFKRHEDYYSPCENDNKDSQEEEKEAEIIDDLEVRRKMEEMLTEEERQEKKNESQQFKNEGNSEFRSGKYDEAIAAYSKALEVCPLNFHKERSIMFANRAACLMKKELFDDAIKDSTSALDLHPHYMKALLRRAELYEKTEKLDEALKDFQSAVELDPSQHMARASCLRLAEQIKERNEKMKEEMIGKLKDLGNLVLRPFGLSVNNFNLEQDPSTGSYSVQFRQNQPNNGS